MKNMIVLAGFFMLNAAQAEVFKCTDAGGKTVYQEAPCKTGASEKVEITPFDPNKIAEAQAKLTERLKQEAEREAAAAEAAQKEAIAAQGRNPPTIININQPPPVYYNGPLYYPFLLAPPRPPRQPMPLPPPQPPDPLDQWLDHPSQPQLNGRNRGNDR